MTAHRPRSRHALGEVDALIDRSALPDEHRALVRQVVRRARLPADTSADVAEELLSHFEDGIERGVSPETLVTRFGCIDSAAELIRRGQRRRRRAEPWRQRSLLAAASIVALMVTTYVSSAVALHRTEPLIASPRATLDRSNGPVWARAGAAVDAARERVRARLRSASPRARRAAVMASFADAAALRRDASLDNELAALAMIHEGISAASDADMDDGAEAILARVLAPGATVLRASVVRAAYEDLLDRVYSGNDGNARVTAKGLRVLQALRGKPSPGVAAVVLEPAYFVAPARRWEIEREIDAIAADVERAGTAAHDDDAVRRLQTRQAALEREPMGALRYFPITVTLPRLVAAALQAQSAARALGTLRASRRGRPAGR